jgi:putative endonuclease
VTNARPLDTGRELGRAAERAVAHYLRARGFQIVAYNLREGPLEIDLVARLNDLVVVVEVRYRGPGSWATAFGSLLPRKRDALRRAARKLWRARYARDPSVTRLRIDAAAVHFTSAGVRIDYCPGAFT